MNAVSGAVANSAVRNRDDIAASERLKVTEIFYSLQGEADTAGWPTVFVRLTGCPLRCHYCDTAYAFHGGEWMSFSDVEREVGRYGARHVCVTGGEPLAQKNCTAMLSRLCDLGYSVSLETSGAINIGSVDERVVRVVDIKTPDSGEADRNLYTNLRLLTGNDKVKFVICSREDYEWSRATVLEHGLSETCEVFFSPGYGLIEPADLADWVLADRLPVRLQVQLHKLLWGEAPGR